MGKSVEKVAHERRQLVEDSEVVDSRVELPHNVTPVEATHSPEEKED
jgi:hypothetical protein